jgi:hypothetical protein
VTPHQAVTVKALSVTLERVLISPGETILEKTTKGPLPNSPDYIFSLNAAGRSSDPTFSGFGCTFIVGFYDGLLGQHGTWTFEISSESGQEGPWVFHFTVP